MSSCQPGQASKYIPVATHTNWPMPRPGVIKEAHVDWPPSPMSKFPLRSQRLPIGLRLCLGRLYQDRCPKNRLSAGPAFALHTCAACGHATRCAASCTACCFQRVAFLVA